METVLYSIDSLAILAKNHCDAKSQNFRLCLEEGKLIIEYFTVKKLIPIMACQAISFLFTAMFVRRMVESPIAEFGCLALSLVFGTLIGLKMFK